MTNGRIPGRARIGLWWGLTTAAATAIAWLVLTGPDTNHTLVGYLLGLWATVLLTGMTGALVRERRTALRAERLRESERLARHTGTWTGPEPEQILRARWNHGTRLYQVKGWMSTGIQFTEWQTWPDIDTLAQHLIRLENSGWLYGDDEGTTQVRLMLALDLEPAQPVFTTVEVDKVSPELFELYTGLEAPQPVDEPVDPGSPPMHKPGPY